MEICRESYGSSHLQRKYIVTKNGTRPKAVNIGPNHGTSWTWITITHFFRNVFLPQGYPESVSEDYLNYQIWDSIQAFASSVTGTLSTQSILKGIGVGNESATVLGATMTWLMIDGTGMIGRFVFAWVQGTNLDCNAKRCRLMADILNDCAILLDILASIVPGCFTFIICIAGLLRSIVGVAGGSTRAALSQHQARRNNMADISVKDGNQETLVNLAALLFSMVLTPFISGNQQITFFLFAIFTIIHLYANYSAVTAVIMETINQARLCVIVQEFLKSSKVLSVREANIQEPVIFSTRRKMSIHLGCSIRQACYDEKNLTNLREIYGESKYLVFVDLIECRIYVLLCKGSSVEDELKGCFQAEVINAAVENLISSETVEQCNILKKLTHAAKAKDTDNIMAQSFLYTQEVFQNFEKAIISQGWITDRALLGADEWRIDLQFTNKKDM